MTLVGLRGVIAAGSPIEAPAFTVRIENATTGAPIPGLRVYRFFDTVRVRHFLGIKRIPSPETVSEQRIAECYTTDAHGELSVPRQTVAGQLYEQPVGDSLYINLAARGRNNSSADARVFYQESWAYSPDGHFNQSIVQAQAGYAGAIVLLHLTLPDEPAMYDGAFVRFSRKRATDRVVIKLAAADQGKVDARATTIEFAPSVGAGAPAAK